MKWIGHICRQLIVIDIENLIWTLNEGLCCTYRWTMEQIGRMKLTLKNVSQTLKREEVTKIAQTVERIFKMMLNGYVVDWNR